MGQGAILALLETGLKWHRSTGDGKNPEEASQRLQGAKSVGNESFHDAQWSELSRRSLLVTFSRPFCRTASRRTSQRICNFE